MTLAHLHAEHTWREYVRAVARYAARGDCDERLWVDLREAEQAHAEALAALGDRVVDELRGAVAERGAR